MSCYYRFFPEEDTGIEDTGVEHLGTSPHHTAHVLLSFNWVLSNENTECLLGLGVQEEF